MPTESHHAEKRPATTAPIDPPPVGSPPGSTYRLQITSEFTLHDAAGLVPYLAELGIGAVYLSPILTAAPGSQHGYDVVDPTTIDPARGGTEGLEALSHAAHGAGLQIVVDIVPNHMGIAVPRAAPWWWDVLARGRASAYADFFDIDWDAGEGTLVLPILGSPEDIGAVVVDGEAGLLRYHDHELPLAPGSTGRDEAPAEDAVTDVDAVLAAQHYRLVPWQQEDWALNYRRFFAVKELAGLRVEDAGVFDASHAEITRWFTEGLVDGVRIDHPDGLADPRGYLERLDSLTGGAWTLVEKITEPGESLPPSWRTAGTTGYEVIRLIDPLLTSPSSAATWQRIAEQQGNGQDFDTIALEAKREFAGTKLRAEFLRLERTALHTDAPGASPHPPVGPDTRGHPATGHVETGADALGPHGEALLEIAAQFHVYRTYAGESQAELESAAARASAARPELSAVIGDLMPRLSADDDPLAVRFRQSTGPVMAKGVEDTAFYRYARLTSLNEVGGTPARIGMRASEFHAALGARSRDTPHAMSALTTHDTKRSEDTRARITALGEIPEEFGEFLETATRAAPLHGSWGFDVLLWQAIIGAWPASRERLHAYALKAAREQGVATTWTAPDERFETALGTAVDAAFDHPEVHAALTGLDEAIRSAGWRNGLIAKALQLLAPGVPDVYQGTELWDRSLVDPDNRRPVDFARLAGLLETLPRTGEPGFSPPAVDETGAAKLHLTRALLQLRRRHPELLRAGVYAGVETGDERLICFHRGPGVLLVASRFPLLVERAGGWHDAVLSADAVPSDETDSAGSWRDVLTGSLLPEHGQLSRIFAHYPVAVYERIHDGEEQS